MKAFHPIAFCLLVTTTLVIPTVKCDLPVSCKKSGGDVSYVGSIWSFHVSQDQKEVDLYEQQEVCTHTMPNKVQIIAQSFGFQFENQASWKVKVVDDSNVLAGECPSSADCQFNVRGTWDILYRESLLVQLENGMRFIANMKYQIRPEYLGGGGKGASASLSSSEGGGAAAYDQPFSKFEKIRTHDYSTFDEQCDKTMVGFVQTVGHGSSLKQHKVQCFYGVLNEPDQAPTADKKPAAPAAAQQQAEQTENLAQNE